MKTIILTIALSLTTILTVYGQTKTTQNFQAGYAPVNGVEMYYEVTGEGEPLVILHGAYMTIEGPLKQLAEKFSVDRKVILAEMQGHGRTADIDRPITYENMADDVAELVRYLQIDSLEVIGYSMGAGVALQLAIRHPEIPKRIVSIAAPVSDTGFQPALKPLIPQITVKSFEGTPFKMGYDSLAPNPDNFPILVQKLKTLDMTPFDWEKDYLKIEQPLFLIFGDSDVVTLDHINDMFTKLGGNVFGDLEPMPNIRLAVLPYTTHVGMLAKWDWLLPMINEFLSIE